MEPLKIPLKDQEQPWTLCEWPRGSSCWFPPFLPLAGEPSWGRAARTGKPEDPCEREWSWIKVVQWQKGWIKELWIAVNSNTTACTSAPVAVLPNISDHSIVAATFSLSHNVIITSQWSLEAMIFPQSWKFHKVILSPPRIKPQPECPLLIRPAKPQFLISSSPHQILIYEDISLYQVTSAGPCTEPLWEHPSLCCTQVPPYKIFRKEDMFNSRKIYSQK